MPLLTRKPVLSYTCMVWFEPNWAAIFKKIFGTAPNDAKCLLSLFRNLNKYWLRKCRYSDTWGDEPGFCQVGKESYGLRMFYDGVSGMGQNWSESHRTFLSEPRLSFPMLNGYGTQDRAIELLSKTKFKAVSDGLELSRNLRGFCRKDNFDLNYLGISPGEGLAMEGTGPIGDPTSIKLSEIPISFIIGDILSCLSEGKSRLHHRRPDIRTFSSHIERKLEEESVTYEVDDDYLGYPRSYFFESDLYSASLEMEVFVKDFD